MLRLMCPGLLARPYQLLSDLSASSVFAIQRESILTVPAVIVPIDVDGPAGRSEQAEA